MILERVGARLSPECVRILHIDTAHWLFHRHAQYSRLFDLQQRRGATLRTRKILEPNLAIEYADCATMVGNEFTGGTFAYANKMIHRVPISTVYQAPWPDGKDFDRCRNNYLWFGSLGLVHKGLDLVYWRGYRSWRGSRRLFLVL